MRREAPRVLQAPQQAAPVNTIAPLQTELVDAEGSAVFTFLEYFFTLAFTFELGVNAVAYFVAPFFQASADRGWASVLAG